jgi:hypothetical protein
MSNKAYDEFVSGLESFGIKINDASLQEKNLIKDIYKSTLNFIADHNLVAGSQLADGLESLGKPMSIMNSNVSLSSIGHDAIHTLCVNAKIPQHLMSAAMKSVAFCIVNDKSRDLGTHFSTSMPSMEGLGEVDFRRLDSVFGVEAMKDFSENAAHALEDFGMDSDKLTTDIRMNIAITLLRFHKNVIDRMINRKPCSGNVVQFEVPYAEVYDLASAGASTSAVRNRGDHRVPFIDLYKNPEAVRTAAKKIVPLKANDSNPATMTADTRILFGAQVNLFDLALDANTIGYTNVDHTDLVSDGVKLDTIYLQLFVDNGGVGDITDIIPIVVKNRSGAGFHMRNNAQDSADRNCVLAERIKLNDETLKLAGTAALGLAAITGDAFLQLDLNVSGNINLKTADTHVYGTVKAAVATISGDAAAAEVTTAFDTMTFTLLDYSLDARYSEENMRKTTTAIKTAVRPMAYEIPVGKNIVVDYSLQQMRPDNVLDIVSQALALGNDYRHISHIIEAVATVYDRLANEDTNNLFIDHKSKISFDYVAGMKVNPFVYMDTLKLSDHVTNLQSGRIFGDIRSAVDKYLLEIFALMYVKSFYLNALDAGEKPRFRVLTSSAIIAAILNIEHYHDHLNKPNTADGTNIEFTRVLPNGTIMEVISTTWDTSIDKMLIIPYRAGAPESELNFGQNCDRGTFVANYSPTQNQATIRRIATNSREAVITTNPVAAVITVTDVSAIFETLGGMGV